MFYQAFGSLIAYLSYLYSPRIHPCCNSTGAIPHEIGDLLSLKILGLDSNLLTGSIPTEIGNLTMLEELYISLNNLTGMMS